MKLRYKCFCYLVYWWMMLGRVNIWFVYFCFYWKFVWFCLSFLFIVLGICLVMSWKMMLFILWDIILKLYKEILVSVVDFWKKKDKYGLIFEVCWKVYGKIKVKDKLLSVNIFRLSIILIIKEWRGMFEEIRDFCWNNFLVK